MAVVPMVEEAQIPFISLAGANVIVEPVKKWVFKMPHSDRMAVEKVYEDMKKRNLTNVAVIGGIRRLRPVLPQGSRGDGAEIRHKGCRGRDLRRDTTPT